MTLESQLQSGDEVRLEAGPGVDDLRAELLDQVGPHGRSGVVFKARDSDGQPLAVKLYHRADELLPPPHMNRLRRFFAQGAHLTPVAAFPIAYVRDIASGSRVGIAMEYFDTSSDYFPFSGLGTTPVCEDPDHMRRLALNILEDVQKIHAAGLRVGDFSDNNLLIDVRDMSIVWVDVDSWSSDDFDLKHRSAGYMMPGRDGEGVAVYEDRFAAVVVVSQLLSLRMLHPYAPAKKEGSLASLQDRIDEGHLWLRSPREYAVHRGAENMYDGNLRRQLLYFLKNPTDIDLAVLRVEVERLKAVNCGDCGRRHYDDACARELPEPKPAPRPEPLPTPPDVDWFDRLVSAGVWLFLILFIVGILLAGAAIFL